MQKMSSRTKQNFHENMTDRSEIKGPNNRNFGLTVGAVFAAIGGARLVFFSGSWVSASFAVLGAALVIVALAAPGRLTKANELWMGLGHLLFTVVNPAVMFLLYVVCFVPTGLIMKALRYDPMRRRFDTAAKSYWIDKKKVEIDQPMKYQF